MNFLIVTGLSGAGKSMAVNALEDIGFFCIDNIPVALLPRIVDFALQGENQLNRVAVVMDVRGVRSIEKLQEAPADLDEKKIEYDILFLDANAAAIQRRYKETRRRHPLMSDGMTIEQAMHREQELLRPLREHADFVIDTTLMPAAKLRNELYGLFGDKSARGKLSVNVVSFGFKYGIPIEADLVFDVRFLPNPFYVEKLRPMSGMDAEVQEYVLRSDVAKNFLSKLTDMVDFLLPQYAAEGRYALTIGIGCTGGQHRSVAVAKVLTDYLAARDANVRLRNRDFPKT